MLEEYRKKRDFNLTPEPPPNDAAHHGALRFVIQKHAARRLHYDFRLEVDGVLVSWAVPKGPSLDPGDKRLAVQTEDHPLDYAQFEGVIPKGEYGGGPVIIWDEGTYSPDNDGKTSWEDREEAQKRMREGLKKGKISVFLRGKKLHGSWTLFRLGKSKKDWIILKHKDEFVKRDFDVEEEEPRSVISGRTIDEMRDGRPPADPILDVSKLKGARKARFPSSYEPMLASLTHEPFAQANWIYEPKLDGIRVIALIHSGDVTLLSRRGVDVTASYPDIVRELEAYDENLVLDGEVVALDERGRPSFQLLQQRSGLTRPADVKIAQDKIPAFYYVFDIVYSADRKLEGVPLHDRKTILKQALVPTERVRLVDKMATDGITAYRACIEMGMEGVVAKRADSLYEPGKRSKGWLKVKATVSSEFVICGYTEGTGSRGPTFGSLILGYYEGGRLVYAGGCGTGFNEKILLQLTQKFSKLKTKDCPFEKKPPGKQIQWIEPVLVAEIKFAEWTNDGILRSPVFMRIRDDKRPQDCQRDQVIEHIVEQEAEPMPDKKSSKSTRKSASKPAGKTPAQPSVENIDVIDLGRKRAERQSKNWKEERSQPVAVDESVLDQLDAKQSKLILDVQGHKISFTNLDKVFWPEHNGHPPLTKRDYAIYLTQVAPWLLAHMKDRPITFVRFPHGIEGGKFYQKHWEKGLPEFVQTTWIFVEHVSTAQEYVVCNNLPTLLWLAQIADLELHTWQSRINPAPDAYDLASNFSGSLKQLESSLLNYPDYLLFDLDPYIYSGKEKSGEEPALNIRGFRKCAELAKWLKEIFDVLGIQAFIKTTGKTGLHIYIPIVREFSFDDVRAISETIGRKVMAQHPNDVTMEWAVVKRTGKIFLDHNMNARGKTLASIYSPRVSPQASVSVPIRWDELDDVYPTDFTMHSVPDLLAKRGDLWADILDHKNDLRAIFNREPNQPNTKPSRRRKSS